MLLGFKNLGLVDAIKLFWCEFTYSFCKLGCLRALRDFILIIKWSSLLKTCVNLSQKSMM
jgi:hypothetical protein